MSARAPRSADGWTSEWCISFHDGELLQHNVSSLVYSTTHLESLGQFRLSEAGYKKMIMVQKEQWVVVKVKGARQKKRKSKS